MGYEFIAYSCKLVSFHIETFFEKLITFIKKLLQTPFFREQYNRVFINLSKHLEFTENYVELTLKHLIENK